jgi:hypothetical protein
MLELQSTFAGSISQGFDPPNVPIPTAVKYYLADAFFPGPFGQDFANPASLLGFV